MTLVTTGELVAEAHARGAAIAAVNVITLEHAEAVVVGAERAGRPVVVQVSQNAVRFHSGRPGAVAAACRVLAGEAAVPVALHLDHVDDVDLLRLAPAAGFSSVMFDAGALPYDDNVASTADAAAWAHDAGLWLEAELGYVGGKPDAPQTAHAPGVRTDPGEAHHFVATTRVDALAVAVGSAHAMRTRTASIDLDLVARLADAVPVPLVLHGSSGVPDDVLVAAVRAGLTKINVGTALNLAMTAAVRDCLADPDVVDPRTYLAAARDAMADTVARLLDTLGSAAG